jgi:hypothetical protein
MSDKTIDYHNFDDDSFDFKISNLITHCYIHNCDHCSFLSYTLISLHLIAIAEYSFTSLHFHMYFEYLIHMAAQFFYLNF